MPASTALCPVIAPKTDYTLICVRRPDAKSFHMRSIRDRRLLLGKVREIIQATGGYAIEGKKQFLLGAYPRKSGVERGVEAGVNALKSLLHAPVKIVRYTGMLAMTPDRLATPRRVKALLRGAADIDWGEGALFTPADMAEGDNAGGGHATESKVLEIAEIVADLWASRPFSAAAIRSVYMRIRSTFDKDARAYLELVRAVRAGGNLHGVGVGVEGERSELRLLVHDLIPASSYPSELRLDGQRVRVRLVRSLPMEEQLHARRHPIHPGLCIASSTGQQGTLTLIVAKPNRPETHYVLSCAHVMAAVRERKGDRIYQPCRDECGETRCVARFEKAIWSRDGNWSTVDAAIAKIDPTIEARSSVDHAAVVLAGEAPRSSIAPGKPLKAFGAENDSLRIRVRTLYVSLRKREGDKWKCYRDVVGASLWSKAGDSGALLLDNANRVVGMHMALLRIFDEQQQVSDAESIFCRWENIAYELGIRLV